MKVAAGRNMCRNPLTEGYQRTQPKVGQPLAPGWIQPQKTGNKTNKKHTKHQGKNTQTPRKKKGTQTPRKLQRPRIGRSGLLERGHEAADAALHSRSQWFSMLWQQLATESPSLCVASVANVDGAVLADSCHESEALASYWGKVFAMPDHDASAEELEDLLSWSVPFPWDQISLTQADFMIALVQSRETAPGPDGPHLHYVHACQTRVVSDSGLRYLRPLASGEELPFTWSESLIVFLPKSEASALTPDQFRPLSLFNVVGKVFGRAMMKAFQEHLPPHLHSSQHGYLPQRGAYEALMDVETSCLALASQARDSSLFLLDIRRAFPSLNRSWVEKLLLKTGATGWQLGYFQHLLRTSPAYLRWRGSHYHTISLASGLLQGHPMAAHLFYMVGLARLLRGILGPMTLSLYVDDVCGNHRRLTGASGFGATLV